MTKLLFVGSLSPKATTVPTYIATPAEGTLGRAGLNATSKVPLKPSSIRSAEMMFMPSAGRSRTRMMGLVPSGTVTVMS